MKTQQETKQVDYMRIVLRRALDISAVTSLGEAKRESSLAFLSSLCSQSLLNLLIIGLATPHVFDGDKDLGGIGKKGLGCFEE